MTDRELMQKALDCLLVWKIESSEYGWSLADEECVESLRARLAQPENDFNPDWDAMAVMVEEQQRMAKRIEELEARLAQPEQEPVAWGVPNTRPAEKAQFMMLLHSADGCQYPDQLVPLYTAPPQREWVGLTDKDIEDCLEMSIQGTCRAIEAKLKEKNGNKSICD